MFGISLDLEFVRFKNVLCYPKALLVGLLTQWLMLPVFTLILIWFTNPIPSLTLGMILVACCPGGNMSNFISVLAKANVELSIVLTLVSSIGAIFLTPVFFNFYSGIFQETKSIIREINLNWFDITKNISLIIIIPLIFGKFMSLKLPNFVDKIKAPLRLLSILNFSFIVISTLLLNGRYFIEYISEVL